MLIKHISCILFRVLFLIISLVSLSPAPTPSGLIVSTAWYLLPLPPHCIYSLVSSAPTPSLYMYLQLGLPVPWPPPPHLPAACSRFGVWGQTSPPYPPCSGVIQILPTRLADRQYLCKIDLLLNKEIYGIDRNKFCILTSELCHNNLLQSIQEKSISLS